ncbi:MAG: ATP-dependent Clp protease adaptor ClpS [Bacteroidota bacterium]
MNKGLLFAVETETEEEVLVLTETEKQNSIILFNDDVNTFDFVIETLVMYCQHDPVQAEQCAYIVHYKGKCPVKNGTYDELEPICTRMLQLGLSAEIA